MKYVRKVEKSRSTSLWLARSRNLPLSAWKPGFRFSSVENAQFFSVCRWCCR